MYCDRSAYYQKAIKATVRLLKIYANLLWLFLLFGRLITPVTYEVESEPILNHYEKLYTKAIYEFL